MVVKVIPFASAKDVLQYEAKEIVLDDNTSVAALMEKFVSEYPILKDKMLLFAANKEYVGTEYILRDKDELAIFPPVSGG